jgi:hypothetical protein
MTLRNATLARWATALTVLVALFAPHHVLQAKTKPRQLDPGPMPESILWVGNSFFDYNNSMHNHLGRLVAASASDARVRRTSVTISGSSLAGTSLAACTVYATLYRKSPSGLRYSAGLNPELAALLQSTAWETVQEYFKPSIKE